jgi:hypothetical protein
MWFTYGGRMMKKNPLLIGYPHNKQFEGILGVAVNLKVQTVTFLFRLFSIIGIILCIFLYKCQGKKKRKEKKNKAE